MSHRVMGVILRPGQNLRDLLAPYLYYSPEDEEGQKYLVRRDVDDECRKDYERHRDKWNSIDAFAATRYNNISKDPETGRFYTLDNPNGFMDSWVLGGRWSGELPLRPGVQREEIPKGNQMGGSERMLVAEMLFSGSLGDHSEPGYASFAKIGDIITEQDEATVAALKRVWGLMAGTIPITDADTERWPGIRSDDEVRSAIEELWGCEENFVLMQKFNNFREYITPDGVQHSADGAAAGWMDSGYVTLFGKYYCCLWKEPIQKRFREFFVPENYLAVVDFHF